MIEVHEDALESIKAMAEKLQQQNDMLLEELKQIYEWAKLEKCALRPQEIASIRSVIAKVEQEPPMFDNPKISGT